MKHKVVLSDSEIQAIINELNVSINSTDDYTSAMYLSNIVKKLKGSSNDDYMHIVQPHSPHSPKRVRELAHAI